MKEMEQQGIVVLDSKQEGVYEIKEVDRTHRKVREFVPHVVDPDPAEKEEKETDCVPISPIIEVYKLPKLLMFLLNQPGMSQGKKNIIL